MRDRHRVVFGVVSTAAKHTKPHRKQAVSHPPTKTPQHLNAQQHPTSGQSQHLLPAARPRGRHCPSARAPWPRSARAHRSRLRTAIHRVPVAAFATPASPV
ncbi:hypothetical protein DIJ64_07530 [Mycobacterium leprae]|uniref:Uncharacterized protein n=1 Tax=Mycobacterium leprae TaxID=1769 RepID=A0AAD0KSA9_MYCLR|nr:hypothetical protein DIJ64_07530 [Mycobacterium leprae]